MTAHRSNRRWRHLGLGLLGLAGLVWAGGSTIAPLAAGAVPTQKPTSTSSGSTFTWSTVSPPVTPPPLAYTSAVYDRDNQTIVLFGGMESGGELSNDTWVWNGSSWTDHPGSQSQAPPPRDQASMAFDPTLHQLILFGGIGTDGQPLGDTWAWNGASWYQETGSAVNESPSPRQGAAMGYDGNGQLILFGGIGAASTAPVDPTTSSLSTSSLSTSSLSTSGLSTSGPVSASATSSTSSASSASPTTGPRALAAATSADLDDTWLWTANGWESVAVAAPTPRSGASMAFDSSRGDAVLFGGESMSLGAAPPTWQNDTWSWSGTSWSHVTTVRAPAGRAGAVLAADGPSSGLLLFGGSGVTGTLGDTSTWNGRSWTAAHTTGAPSARSGAAAAFDDDTGQLVLFGGVSSTGTVLGDTVILKTGAPTVLGPGSATSSSSTAGASSTSTSSPAGSDAPGSTTARPADTSASASPGPAGVSRSTSTTNPGSAAPSPHHLHRGDLVTVSGQGFSPGAAVTVTFHSTPIVVGRTVANKEGDFSATVAVPEAAKAGVHQIDASGRGPGGEVDELIASVDVVGVPGSPAASPVEKAVLTGLALLIPLATWFFLAGTGWWRRRHATANRAAPS